MQDFGLLHCGCLKKGTDSTDAALFRGVGGQDEILNDVGLHWEARHAFLAFLIVADECLC